MDGTLNSETGNTLDGTTGFDKDQEVYVVVTPNDGYEDGDAVMGGGGGGGDDEGAKECKFCHAVRYCGHECRVEHWDEHRPVCTGKPSAVWKAAAAKRKAAGQPPLKRYACALCGAIVEYEGGHGRATSGKKGCARCRRVFYCSARCEAEHWPAHLPSCQQAAASDDDEEGAGGGGGGGD